MKKRTTDKEIQALCLALIQDFLKKWHYSNTRLIDIETFLTEYLGAKIVYESFAEKVPGRGGFIADGNRPLPVLRNGVKQDVVFPMGFIVTCIEENDDDQPVLCTILMNNHGESIAFDSMVIGWCPVCGKPLRD